MIKGAEAFKAFKIEIDGYKNELWLQNKSQVYESMSQLRKDSFGCLSNFRDLSTLIMLHLHQHINMKQLVDIKSGPKKDKKFDTKLRRNMQLSQERAKIEKIKN